MLVRVLEHNGVAETSGSEVAMQGRRRQQRGSAFVIEEDRECSGSSQDFHFGVAAQNEGWQDQVS